MLLCLLLLALAEGVPKPKRKPAMGPVSRTTTSSIAIITTSSTASLTMSQSTVNFRPLPPNPDLLLNKPISNSHSSHASKQIARRGVKFYRSAPFDYSSDSEYSTGPELEEVIVDEKHFSKADL